MTGNYLAIIVLAAGQGTRMKSKLPKVLHPLAGRTLVGHVLTAAARLQADTVEVVVRHERDQVAAALAEAHPEAVIVAGPGIWRLIGGEVTPAEAIAQDLVAVVRGEERILEAFARTQANIFFRHPVRLQRLAIAGKQRRVVSIVERLPVLQLINTHHRRQGGAFGIVIHAFPGAKIQMQGFHLGVKNGLGHGNGTVFHGLRQSAAG